MRLQEKQNFKTNPSETANITRTEKPAVRKGRTPELKIRHYSIFDIDHKFKFQYSFFAKTLDFAKRNAPFWIVKSYLFEKKYLYILTC